MTLDFSLKTLTDDFFAQARPQATKDEAMTIHSIAMVGAMQHAGQIEPRDYVNLYNTLNMLTKIGLAIDRSVDIDFVNIDPQQGGRDFLKEDKQADLVVLNSLFNPFQSGISDISNELMKRNTSLGGFFCTSPHHRDNGAWHDRLVRSAAKIVTTIGSDDSEVGPSLILANLKEKPIYHHVHREDWIRDFLVDRAWAKNVHEKINPATDLGRRIKAFGAQEDLRP